MSLNYTFTCLLPNGIHARPASALEGVARPFASEITFLNTRTGLSADGKSVLGIIGMDTRLNDVCLLTISGPDEHEAMAALSVFLEKDFPACDEPLPGVESGTTATRLPPMLEAAGAKVRFGTPVAPGIGQGVVVKVGGLTVPDSIPRTLDGDLEAEWSRLNAALTSLQTSYQARLSRAKASVEADVIKAHLSVARDPGFRRELERGITERRRTVAGAVADTGKHFLDMLAATGSMLLRERALDIQDVCGQILKQVYAGAIADDQKCLTADAVVVAEALTPSQFLGLDRRYLKGLVLGHAGTTSHTVILARSFGIPSLVGVADYTDLAEEGKPVVVDAALGAVVTSLTPEVCRYYDMEHRRMEGRKARWMAASAQDACTEDGHRVEIAANISTALEAGPAMMAGAEGIGLFRTEMLFMDRVQAPDEAAQLAQYRQALQEAGGRPVIIRTLDVGGDKMIPYLNLPSEENPFLGYRAVRLYPEFESLFRTQVRALIKASSAGCLKVMIPMVGCLEEVQWVRGIVAEEQAACKTEGIPFDGSMAVGAMIEIPSAVFQLEALCGVLDFFSVGTNDLLQYFMAVDRANERVAGLYNPLQPSFLRLLKMAVDSVHSQGKWIGLCGELGGQASSLALLVGLGFDEISMSATKIPEIKTAIRTLSLPGCRELAGKALECSTAAEVVRQLEWFAAARPLPLLDPALVMVDSDCSSKAEAIKQAVDQLYVLGRTDQPRGVEEAVWQREAVYSTGFGHGFAIPHCKTDAIRANSLVVLRMKQGIEWGSLDGEPVRLLILLTIRESDQATAHMKIFAALARRVMHEEFRDRLMTAPDPAAIMDCLRDSLGL